MVMLPVLICSGLAVGQCESFHTSLDTAAAIASEGGSIHGASGFVPGVNSNGISFSGGFAVFPDTVFQSNLGSISFWLRKTSADAQGGIAQIGNIGQPNSVGVYYVNDTDVSFEIRGENGMLAIITEPGLLHSGGWRHLVVTWRGDSNGVSMFTFVDGLFRGFASMPSSLDVTAQQIQLGVTGFYGFGECDIDELRFFDWPLLDGEAYAEFVFSAKRFVRQEAVSPISTGPVQIVNGELVVEGKPFVVKGAAYAPTPVGFDVGQFPVLSNPGIVNRDAPILRAMAANVIRTYTPPPNNALLDALYNGGVDPIYMIMGYYVPVSGIDYGDPGVVALHQNQFAAMVTQFKDHPSVLAWGIGNEVNLSKSPQELADWFAMAEVLASTAHSIEGAAYHPTMIVNGSMIGLGDAAVNSDDVSLASVDLWGMNLYFGDHPRCHFDYYHRLSAKPLVVTEFGIDALDDRVLLEYPTTQADFVVRQWRWIEQTTSGATVFEFCDEWWKGGTPSIHDFGGYGTSAHPDGFSNEEWWGLFSIADNGSDPDVLTARPAQAALATEFAHDPGDFDQDADVDLADYGAFQICAGGSAEGACGSAFEFVVDDIVSVDDLYGLINKVTGPM